MTDAAFRAIYERLRLDTNSMIDELSRAWDKAREECDERNERTCELFLGILGDLRLAIALASAKGKRPMTSPKKSERMTDNEIDRALIGDDLATVDTEIRRARSEERRLTGELVASNALCDALALELGDVVLGRVQAEGERDEALERRDGYRESARRLARLFGQRFEDTLCGYAFDCGTSPFSLRCAHCRLPLGEFCSDDDSMAAARAHVVACSSHPMRAVEAERDSARADSERLARERDAAQMMAKATARELGEVGAEKLKVECERDVALKEVERLRQAVSKRRNAQGLGAKYIRMEADAILYEVDNA